MEPGEAHPGFDGVDGSHRRGGASGRGGAVPGPLHPLFQRCRRGGDGRAEAAQMRFHPPCAERAARGAGGRGAGILNLIHNSILILHFSGTGSISQSLLYSWIILLWL